MSASLDLAAIAREAVPPSVLARLSGARNVLAVSHEHPDADSIGATLAVCALVEAHGGRATAVCSDPVPELYAFLPGVERFRTDPDPTAAYDLLVLCDCASEERVGPVAARHAPLFAGLPRVVIDHHASNDGRGDADWLDPRAGDAPRRSPGDPARCRWRRARDGPHGRDRHGHRDLRPSQRDAADPGGVGGAGRGGSAVVRHLTEAVPDQAGHPAPAVRAGAGPAPDHPRPACHLVHADACGPRGHRFAARALRGDHRPALPVGARRGVDAAQGAARRHHAPQRPHQARGRGRDRGHGRVRGWGTCPRGGCHDRRAAGRRDRARPRGRRALDRRGAPVRRGDRSGGLDGVLVVAKPSGPTSHDVVGLVRRLSSTRRVGHGGTLDPFAAGVLPVFLGRATRLVEYHLGATKRYRATICFGETSTTDDIDGERTPIAGPPVTRGAVEAALAAMTGPLRQVPPDYSAVQVAGRRAYQMARAGEAVELAARDVTIHALTLLDWDESDPSRPVAVVDVECSAGTYVRALARDLGARLDSGAYLGALVRTASGEFRLEDAVSFEELRLHA